ncbi:MAG: hypothetical protein IMF26_11120 [Candidatus Fermentithermobacillus carboniphilus]|uniref:Uncharacterized protein n=1 Tax=Candidatus Fermentithermobacillus carboniphilus TaxID=3085328 RepID=A0AAT9LBS7_9FIRM|nr:MAG: hypothetical protein IMF26_11120 [Candidatus Fermentithermobacillus carboniphilus]
MRRVSAEETRICGDFSHKRRESAGISRRRDVDVRKFSADEATLPGPDTKNWRDLRVQGEPATSALVVPGG